MHIDQNLRIGLAQEALNMESGGKEEWCVSWLEWFWQEEIESAICAVQLDKPGYSRRPTQTSCRKLFPFRVGLTA